jgi:hypothetical protein
LESRLLLDNGFPPSQSSTELLGVYGYINSRNSFLNKRFLFLQFVAIYLFDKNNLSVALKNQSPPAEHEKPDGDQTKWKAIAWYHELATALDRLSIIPFRSRKPLIFARRRGLTGDKKVISIPVY